MPPQAELLRFAKSERWVHRSTAILMGICLLTAATLYFGPLSTLVGRRALVAWIHVIAGCCLPVPFLIGLVSKAFRADVRTLNRFTPADWRWLRPRERRRGKLPVGKFNAGQKLNANFQLGAIFTMLGTGLIMRFANHWPLSWRTGATFVHDWMAYAIFAVVVGHIWMATHDPYALGGMRTGYVPESWAKREHAAWAAREKARLGAEKTAAK
jgi:formate dehydrogenase subunit gamma